MENELKPLTREELYKFFQDQPIAILNGTVREYSGSLACQIVKEFSPANSNGLSVNANAELVKALKGLLRHTQSGGDRYEFIKICSEAKQVLAKVDSLGIVSSDEQIIDIIPDQYSS